MVIDIVKSGSLKFSSFKRVVVPVEIGFKGYLGIIVTIAAKLYVEILNWQCTSKEFIRPQASLVREGLRLLVKRLRRRGCTQGQCIGAIFAAPMEEIGTWDNGTDVALTPRSTWVDCEEECVDRRA